WFTGHGDVNCPAGLIIPVRRPWGLATAGLGVGAATALAARRAAGYAARRAAGYAAAGSGWWIPNVLPSVSR
ncbi:MAG TPA: hypothetical protein VIJ07_01510, partial [Dermatophilaceae bacterium]